MNHPTSTRASALLLAAGCCLPVAGIGAEQAIELEPIQVRTATRAEEKRSDSLASVTVITAEDIRHSVAQDLYELLRLEAGIDVVRTGGPGQQTSVFMRGANSNHALVLIDGIRVSSTHTGTYAWEHLPLNQVERVEIVRGPRGSVYGSDAIGGVIQVFTRQAGGPYFRATAGSHVSREVEAGTGFRAGTARFALAAAARASDGFSAQNPDGFSYDPDKDGFRAQSVHFGGTGELASGAWQFSITGIDNRVEFDQGVSTSDQVLASASLTGAWRDAWTYRIYSGWHDDRLISDFGFFATRFDSQRIDLGLENRLELDPGTLVFGLDHYNEEGRSDGSYAGSRDNSALFALWNREFGQATIQLSARLDDNSLFGAELTHQAALGVHVGEHGEWVLSQGTAFRAPTLSEQFSPGFGGLFAGNPELGPESSDSLELIYRHAVGQTGRFSIAAYRTRVEDLIAFTGQDFQAVNINSAALDGVEVEYEAAWTRWAVRANATLQQTEDRSMGTDLLRRPDRKGTLRLTRHLANQAWFGAEWFVSGEQADVGGERLPGYAVLNLSAGYPLSPSLRLEARLDNLLDHGYEPARGFNSSGRAVLLGIDWSP